MPSSDASSIRNFYLKYVRPFLPVAVAVGAALLVRFFSGQTLEQRDEAAQDCGKVAGDEPYKQGEDEVLKSFNGLGGIMELETLLGRAALPAIWEVYWPGYWQFPLFSRTWISWTSYSANALRAPDIGRALADYLHQLDKQADQVEPGEPREVIFIAHSLGCRIVLETIQHLVRHQQWTVPGICLMAAAVPTFMLAPNGTLLQAANHADKRYILHSRADIVLHYAFSPGQFFSAVGDIWPEDDPWPEAVGRFGNPRDLWETPHENVVETGLGHGDYYRGRPADLSIYSSYSRSRTAPTLGRLFGRALPLYPRMNDPYVVNWRPAVSPPPLTNKLPIHLT